MLLVAVALFATITSDRWVPVGGSERDYVEYLDTESISRSGVQVTLWTRRDAVRGQATTWNELEFDCSTRTVTTLAYIRDDGGSISHNVDRPHRAASPIPPQSIEERIFEIACGD